MNTDYLKIFNVLPENIQDAILSEDTARKIKAACLSQGVRESEIPLVAELVGDVLMGVIQESALAQKLIEDVHISPEISKNIADAISREVLTPVRSNIPTKGPGTNETPLIPSYEQAPLRPSFAKDESLEFLRSGKLPKPPTPITSPTPAPSLDSRQFISPVIRVAPPTAENISPPIPQVATPPPPTVPPLQQTQTPTMEAQGTGKSAVGDEPKHDTPFMLHKEEEIQPGKENTAPYNVQRPTFYKPVLSEEYKTALGGDKTARVEFGNEREEPRSSEIYKTPNQGPRVVHYSEFRTEVSPFGNQNQSQAPAEPAPSQPTPPPATPIIKPAEVHPNNVINLKDLPLK